MLLSKPKPSDCFWFQDKNDYVLEGDIGARAQRIFNNGLILQKKLFCGKKLLYTVGHYTYKQWLLAMTLN